MSNELENVNVLEVTEVENETEKSKPKETVKQVSRFSLDIKKPVVTLALDLPQLLPDFEPFEFDFKLSLSDEAEDRRQDYLAQSPFNQTVNETSQALDELCDLLATGPRGFEGLTDTGTGPGDAFRAYYNKANGDAKIILDIVIKHAVRAYWNVITPRSFRK